MISLVAIIMLAGTVVNSSIILVEYIKHPPGAWARAAKRPSSMPAHCASAQ